MKKSLYYIFLLLVNFLFFNVVVADTNIKLEEPFYSFADIENFGLQGFTVVKDKLFVVLVGNEDTESIIKIYDLENKKEIKSIHFTSLGHANDVTYNSKTNEVYVLAASGSNDIYTFDGDTFNFLRKFEVSLPLRSITYIEDKDKYAVRTVATGFIYNEDFSLYNRFPFVMGMNINNDIARQGWAYYNGFIYYSNWSWIRLGGDGVNIIYVYDLDGNLRDSIFTDNTIGEVEDVAFYDSKMILGFNGYDGYVKFYFEEVPVVPEMMQKTESEVDTSRDNKINDDINLTIVFVVIVVLIIILIFIKKKKHG